MTKDDASTMDFLLACLRDDQDYLRTQLEEGVDFAAVVECALRNEVLHRLADALAPWPDLVPEVLTEALADHGRRTEALNARLLGEAARIAAAFVAAGLPVMFAKGQFFAAAIGETDRRRLSKDLDIYVRRADVWRAHALLEDLGFDEEHYPLDETLGNSHHHGMYAPASDTIVELHWGVAPARDAVRLDLDAVMDRARPVEIDGAAFPAPCRADLPLFMSVELEKDGWRSLKKLIDLGLLCARTSPDEADLALRQVSAAGKTRVFAISLNVAAALGLARLTGPFAATAADPTAARIAASVVERVRRDGETLPLGFLLRHELMLMRKHTRLGDRIRHVATVSLRRAYAHLRRSTAAEG